MGRLPGKSTLELERLQERHREILRRELLGQSRSEIAKELDISKQSVSTAKNCALGQQQLAFMQAKADDRAVAISQRFQADALAAQMMLSKLMIDDKVQAPTRLKAAIEILDRAGYSPVRRTESVSARLTQEDIEVLKENARRAGVLVPSDTNGKQHDKAVQEFCVENESEETDVIST